MRKKVVQSLTLRTSSSSTPASPDPNSSAPANPKSAPVSQNSNPVLSKRKRLTGPFGFGRSNPVDPESKSNRIINEEQNISERKGRQPRSSSTSRTSSTSSRSASPFGISKRRGSWEGAETIETDETVQSMEKAKIEGDDGAKEAKEKERDKDKDAGPRFKGDKKFIIMYFNILIIDKEKAIKMSLRKKLEEYELGLVAGVLGALANALISEEIIAHLLAPLFAQELPKFMMQYGLFAEVEVSYQSGRFFVLKLIIKDIDTRSGVDRAMEQLEKRHTQNPDSHSVRRHTEIEAGKQVQKLLDLTYSLENKGGLLGKVGTLVNDSVEAVAWKELEKALFKKVPKMLEVKFAKMGMAISCVARTEKDQLCFFFSTLCRFKLHGAGAQLPDPEEEEKADTPSPVGSPTVGSRSLSQSRLVPDEKETVFPASPRDSRDSSDGATQFPGSLPGERHDVHVTILRAENLPVMDRTTSDPYVKIACRPLKIKLRTTVKKKQLNPVWNEEFALSGLFPSYSIRFVLMDQDLTFDDFMGEFSVQVSDLLGKEVGPGGGGQQLAPAPPSTAEAPSAARAELERWFDINKKYPKARCLVRFRCSPTPFDPQAVFADLRAVNRLGNFRHNLKNRFRPGRRAGEGKAQDLARARQSERRTKLRVLYGVLGMLLGVYCGMSTGKAGGTIGMVSGALLGSFAGWELGLLLTERQQRRKDALAIKQLLQSFAEGVPQDVEQIATLRNQLLPRDVRRQQTELIGQLVQLLDPRALFWLLMLLLFLSFLLGLWLHSHRVDPDAGRSLTISALCVLCSAGGVFLGRRSVVARKQRLPVYSTSLDPKL